MDRRVAGDVAPWIERFARFGFVGRGVLYLYVSAHAMGALGSGRELRPNSRHEMHWLGAAALGRVIDAIVAIGLIGYAVWRFVDAGQDPSRRGRGARAIAARTGYVASGVLSLGLAWVVASFVIHDGVAGDNLSVAKALSLPAGVYLVWIAAAGVLGYGVHQIYAAWRATLPGDLRFEAGHTIVLRIARFGIAARGIVFATLAVLVAHAARDRDPHEARGVRGSLGTLFEQLGRWPYLVIALGLGAYGIYELINAKYRRLPAARAPSSTAC